MTDDDDAQDAESDDAEDPDDVHEEYENADTRLNTVDKVLNCGTEAACDIYNKCLDKEEAQEPDISELFYTAEVQDAMRQEDWQQSEQHIKNLRAKSKAHNSM